MLLQSVLLLFSTVLVVGQHVSGVFTKIDSLVYEAGANYPTRAPSNPSWIATVNWVIDGSKFSAGDTFTLNLPCVFKFTTNDQTVDLVAGSTTMASCSFNPGELVVDYSELSCRMSDNVVSTTNAKGSIRFPFVFNIGGSSNPNDIKDASCLTDGTNTISFFDGDNELTTTANFEGGSLINENPQSIVYRNRVVPSLGQQQHYLLAGNCPNGYSSGTLGFSFTNGVADCGSAHQAISDSFNTWFMPESASSDFQYTTSCDRNGFFIDYQNIPAGFRPFIDILGSPTGGSLRVRYTNTYVCAGSYRPIDSSRVVSWGSYQNSGTGSGGSQVVVTIETNTWTGTYTQVTTLPYTSGGTKTIEVNVPVPSTTITITGTDSITETTTLPFTTGGTKTIEVIVPPPVTTITVTGSVTETQTTTLPVVSGETETVEIIVPTPVTTITITGSVTETQTTTLPIVSGETETVEIIVPTPVTTITITGSVTETQTTTLPIVSGETETVEIIVPTPVTPVTTITITGSVTETQTTTLPIVSGETETVEIIVPTPVTPVTTITVTGSVTKTQTTTLPIVSGETETVEIIVPPSSVPSSTFSYSSLRPSWNSSSSSIQVPDYSTTLTSSSLESFSTLIPSKSSAVVPDISSSDVPSESSVAESIVSSTYQPTDGSVSPTNPSSSLFSTADTSGHVESSTPLISTPSSIGITSALSSNSQMQSQDSNQSNNKPVPTSINTTDNTIPAIPTTQTPVSEPNTSGGNIKTTSRNTSTATNNPVVPTGDNDGNGNHGGNGSEGNTNTSVHTKPDNNGNSNQPTTTSNPTETSETAKVTTLVASAEHLSSLNPASPSNPTSISQYVGSASTSSISKLTLIVFLTFQFFF